MTKMPRVLAMAVLATLWAGRSGLAETLPPPSTQPAERVERDDSAAERLGWRLAVQAYSFKNFTFDEAVAKAASVGVRYIEAYPGQRGGPSPTMSDEAIAEMKRKLDAAGVRLVNYGVTGLPKDEPAARKVFEWARKMGIETLVTEAYDSTEMLDKLATEFGINIALHNHPGRKPETAVKASEGRSKRIGACADTGHWMRTNIKPLDGIRLLEGRIVSLHFKDLDKFGSGAHDVIWGTGQGDVRAVLAELKRQGFRGVFSIEYEHNWNNSVPEIRKCVKAFDRFAAELLAAEAASTQPDETAG